EPAAAVVVEPIDNGSAAQKPLGRPPRDIDDFAAEQLFALRLVEDRGNGIFVAPHRLLDPPADADRLRHGEVDAPFLDLAACTRGFAGRGDRAHLDADLAARPFHPTPTRRLCHDRLDAARV